MNLGIVKRGHHLRYGINIGVFVGWPYWFQQPINLVWNRIACALYGHGSVFRGSCTDCCRRVK